MDVMHPRCAGLDVHQMSVVACVRIAAGASASEEVRTFETTTKALYTLSSWLLENEVTHVVMESTGVYWKPVWHVLEEGGFELLLANATDVRNLPGRKTDVNDAMWLAQLLAHGLVRSSFVPPAETQEHRGLTRMRKQMVREHGRHALRIQKTLEDANIKIAGVISDILGKSGRAFLAAIIAGETDPERLADHAKGRLKASREEIVEALRGRVTDHHRFTIRMHLDQITALEKSIDEISKRVGERLEPFRDKVRLLTTIPGVSEITAQVIASEMGTDVSRFRSADALVSWAGLCPRSDESAGKRRSTRIRKGAQWLKTVLVQAAWAASRKKNSYLRALYHRLKARRGSMKAIVALAASMLRSVWFMLKRNEEYRDLGEQHFDERARNRTANRLLKRLKDLGVEVLQVRGGDGLDLKLAA